MHVRITDGRADKFEAPRFNKSLIMVSETSSTPDLLNAVRRFTMGFHPTKRQTIGVKAAELFEHFQEHSSRSGWWRPDLEPVAG